MIRQQCIPLASPDEWRVALKGIKHAFAHTWENCYAMHLTTGFKTYLYCFEADNVRIVCPIAERKFEGYIDIVTPYGFSGFVGNGDYPDFSNHWASFVREQGYVCGYIALNPIFENSTYFRFDEVYSSNSLYFLDLALTYDELFANLDRNRKRQLRHWGKAATKLIYERKAVKDFFLENYYAFLRRVNASPANYFSRETLTFLCSLDNLFLVGAGELDNLEAVYLFAYTPYLGDCLFNVALPEGRHHAATLLWCGLNYLKDLKVPLLNLGGGGREDDSVAQSKQRFGSKRKAFRCLKQVYEPKIYADLCRRVNADPTDMTGYFPVYRNPSLASMITGE